MAVEIVASYSGGTGPWTPSVSVQDGDAVIWFLRLAYADAAPGGTIRSRLTDGDGATITFSYADRGDWGAGASTNYIMQTNGEWEWGGDPDQIYVMFDQFTGLTGGNHQVRFTLPASARARVECAHLLRDVVSADPGAFIPYDQPSPQWIRTYVRPNGVKTSDGFPASVPLTANSSLVYCIWSAGESINSLEQYQSVPGTKILEYTFATEVLYSLVSYVPDLSGETTSIPGPTEGGSTNQTSGYIPGGPEYRMSAIVINGNTAPVVSTIYFADLIVFNAAAGTTVNY